MPTWSLSSIGSPFLRAIARSGEEHFFVGPVLSSLGRPNSPFDKCNGMPEHPHKHRELSLVRSRDKQRMEKKFQALRGLLGPFKRVRAQDSKPRNGANTGVPGTKKPNGEPLGFWEMVVQSGIELASNL